MSDTATTTSTRPKRWYIVHAYSNFEKKVAESIREQAKQRGLEDHFDEILVPVETVVEVRRVLDGFRRDVEGRTRDGIGVGERGRLRRVQVLHQAKIH